MVASKVQNINLKPKLYT